MKMKLIKIFIAATLIFSAQAFSQTAPETVRIDAPVMVAVDSSFAISIVHNFERDISDDSFFDISFPDNIELQKVFLRNGTNEEILKFDEDATPLKVKLLSEESAIDFASPVQIVFVFSSKAIEPEEIEIAFNSSENFTEWTETIPVDFYFISEIAGGAAEIVSGSSLIIQPEGEFKSENFTIEFWGKFDSAIEKFFSIINKFSSDTLFTINNSALNILECPSSASEMLCEAFLSPSNWYHFAIELLQSENELNFYVNGEKVISKDLFDNFTLNDLTFEFQNNEEGKTFYIDELHVWENEKAIIGELEKSSSYDIPVEENAKKILDIGFNEATQFSDRHENFAVKFRDVKKTQSDAPLFTRAPSIDVEQFSGYNLISWESKDEISASEFVVEKSSADGRYEEIYFKESTGEESEYYYSDYRQAEDGVVYYRVKQINKDGSVVYSPSVKIGLRELKEFEIVQNFPNPFNPTTNISVNILVAGEYKIRVYSVTGKIVADLENGFLSTGTHEYTFNGAGLTSGIYFFEIKSQTSVRAIKMIMTK